MLRAFPSSELQPDGVTVHTAGLPTATPARRWLQGGWSESREETAGQMGIDSGLQTIARQFL